VFEEQWGLFGIIFYIIVMACVFAIPTLVGLFSGLVAISKRKLKTAIALWSLILFSPVIFILVMGVVHRTPGFIGNSLVPEPAYSLTVASGTLPFVVPVWILGLLILIWRWKRTLILHKEAYVSGV